jgi:hypothetical protein
MKTVDRKQGSKFLPYGFLNSGFDKRASQLQAYAWGFLTGACDLRVSSI